MRGGKLRRTGDRGSESEGGRDGIDMPILVKICGIRNPADAGAAIDAGADALGFLVGLDYPSDDALGAREARKIALTVPAPIRRVLVTHRTTAAEVAGLVRESACDAVQLHGEFPASEAPALREALGGASIVRVVHVDGEAALDRAAAVAVWADALVLDTRTAGRLGGTGITHDWSLSARIVAATSRPVILAGGLTPRNVGEAVRLVRPFAVDVNSGVEDTTGSKDPARVRAFVTAARRAAARVDEGPESGL